MATTIDVSDVVSQYGSYYEKNADNMNKLKTQLRVKPRSADAFMPHFTESTRERLVNETMDEVVQSSQTAWTAKTTDTMEANEIQLYNLKIDFDAQPDKFKNSYLQYLNTVQSQQDRTAAPYIAHVMQQLIAQAHQDREVKSYRYGQYVAPTAGTAGKAINAMDGLIRVVTNAVNAGGHQFDLANDPAGATTAFDAFEEMADGLPSEFEGHKVCFWADPVLVRKMLRDKRNTLGTNVDYSVTPIIDFSDIYGDGQGWEVKPLQCLAGTGMVIVSPYENIVHATHGEIPTPRVEGYRRTVSIFTDWWEGFGVVRPELVYMYRPDFSYSGSTSGTII